MFINICKNCLSSNISILSKAKDDIVVSEPQKPIAIKKEYFESKLKKAEMLQSYTLQHPFMISLVQKQLALQKESALLKERIKRLILLLYY